MTQLRDDLITVEVPEGLLMPSYEVERTLHAIMTNGDESELVVRYIQRRCGSPTGKITIKLPPGSWQFICTTKDITEKQAKGIVGSSEWYFPERHIRYIDYNHLVGPDGKQAWNIGFSNALLSLRSLLASKGLDVSKNYALLKKG